MRTNQMGPCPILYLHEYRSIPADILRWKNDEELKPWQPDAMDMTADLKWEDPAEQLAHFPQRLCVGVGVYKTTIDGEIYLCVLIDPESRKVFSYSLGAYRSAELVGKALENLFAVYGKPERSLILRSSQNSLYKTKLYGEILAGYPVRAGMTEKGTRGGVMAISTFYSQLMRRKGSLVFRNWQEAIDWLSCYIWRQNQEKRLRG